MLGTDSKTVLFIDRNINCLDRMANLVEDTDLEIEEILQQFIEIVPKAMSCTETVYVEICVQGLSCITKKFRRTKTFLSRKIFTEHKSIGSMSVYLDSGAFSGTPNFNDDEIGLIEYLCKLIGWVIHQHKLTEELHSIKKKFEFQNKILEKKCIALNEVLTHCEEEKQKEKENILHNLDEQVFPIINKMKNSADPGDYIDVLSNTLTDITSDFSRNVKDKMFLLSPKEMEICNFLRNGYSSKEIGALLYLSPKTVNKHRDNIRIKFGLRNRRINLVTFLRSIS